jgi:hypothetical protein
VTPARVVFLLLVLAAAGWLAHRGLCEMERRGWIYYRTKGSASMGASALFSLNEVFHPSSEHVVVEQREQDLRGPRRQSPTDNP